MEPEDKTIKYQHGTKVTMNLDDAVAKPTRPSLHQLGFTGSGYEYPDIKTIERRIKENKEERERLQRKKQEE